jgi:hypothetical protein
MNDDKRKMLEEGCAQLESRAGLVWGPEYIEEFAAAIRAALAEIDALKAELAALKAHDPLAEMWRELEAYRPMADRDGHGESWAKMCEDRTNASAWNAANAAAKPFAANAAGHAAFAVSRSQLKATKRLADEAAKLAIDAIRRAKEAKR